MLKFRAHFAGWAAAAIFAAAGMPCPAQTAPTANPPAFSQPADHEIANPESNENLPVANSSMQAPQFFRMGPVESLGAPTPDLNPAWQKQQQERSEWSLQTPEEIMGLQTPRQMFGLPEEDENLSPEERYLHRQNQAKASAAQSLLTQPDRLSESGGLTHDFSLRFYRADGAASTLAPADQDDPASFSHMFKDAGSSPFGGGKGTLYGSMPATSVSAAQTAKEQLDQAAEMARFRSLIGEAPSTPAPAPTPYHSQFESGLQPATAFGFDPFGPVGRHTSGGSQ